MKSGVRISILGLLVGSILAARAADGLSVPEGVWPVWQARLAVQAVDPAITAHVQGRVFTASLLGDYYFSVPRLLPLSREGGLRATSGVTTSSGLRPPPGGQALALSEGGETLPYIGLGYTYVALKGGWGFTADVGLVAENPAGALGVGRSLVGSGAALDDAVRAMRLSPMVQLGVRYSF
jgi:hypothetical protein